MRVAFVHPDLGIGGAERLVVDAAVALQDGGHTVDVYTSHHDPSHCFKETRDGTLRVHVYGDFLPRSIFGGMFLVCAVLRGIYLALALLVLGVRYDVLFVDQLSFHIPILRLTGAKIFFYCHFPDKLLTSRTSALKRLYRAPLDALEERTTGMADAIVVNSRFTRDIFRAAFPSIRRDPDVLYPAINLAAYERPPPSSFPAGDPLADYARHPRTLIVSINRFERKKNIALAVRAFARLRDSIVDEPRFARLQLVVAGGYDPRVTENVEYLGELVRLARESGLSFAVASSDPKVRAVSAAAAAEPGAAESPADAQVLFLLSFTEEQRAFLLGHARVLVYTPANEHFGIVPVEAMYCRVPVIAVNSGGPQESVVHEETGLLLNDTDDDFAAGMERLLFGDIDLAAMGEKGRARVQKMFSLRAMGDALDTHLRRLVAS